MGKIVIFKALILYDTPEMAQAASPSECVQTEQRNITAVPWIPRRLIVLVQGRAAHHTAFLLFRWVLIISDCELESVLG